MEVGNLVEEPVFQPALTAGRKKGESDLPGVTGVP